MMRNIIGCLRTSRAQITDVGSIHPTSLSIFYRETAEYNAALLLREPHMDTQTIARSAPIIGELAAIVEAARKIC